MKKAFITPELQISGLCEFEDTEELNPRNIKKVIEKFKLAVKNGFKIEVLDLTDNPEITTGTLITVNDHINCTGDNPLRGNQKLFKTDFPDLTRIYKQHSRGVITTSWGSHKTEPQTNKFPTKYFCYFGIIAGALGLQPISGFLVNQQQENLLV